MHQKHEVAISISTIETRPKDLYRYRCGKGPQNPQDFKKGDLLLTLLRNIDLEMLPHLKTEPCCSIFKKWVKNSKYVHRASKERDV